MTTLNELQERYPLGARWSAPELVEVSILVNGVAIHLAGLSLNAPEAGGAVTGSAGQTSGSPLPRAYFELLERTAVIDAIQAPDRLLTVATEDGARLGTRASRELFPTSPLGSAWSYSRSNGVAIGQSWPEACVAARRELVERDRVLRSWYGQTRPERLELPGTVLERPLFDLYDFEVYLFPPVLGGKEIEVVGVFGFPRRSESSRVCGFGAHGTLAGAVCPATRECLQQLGFLWQEPVPTDLPEPTRTAQFHLDTYLHPSMVTRIRAWLSGDHGRIGCPASVPPGPDPSANPCADLTPETLSGRLWVAKALPMGELPLVFGRGNPGLVTEPPEPLMVHPIA